MKKNLLLSEFGIIGTVDEIKERLCAEPLVIFAGSYEQYNFWLDENIRDHPDLQPISLQEARRMFVYPDGAYVLRGLNISGVVRYGTWYERPSRERDEIDTVCQILLHRAKMRKN